MDSARVSPRDRLITRVVTGPIGRAAAFAIDFCAALARAVRGRPEHPEERRVPPAGGG